MQILALNFVNQQARFARECEIQCIDFSFYLILKTRMPGRSNSKNRCFRCRMYQPLCLCLEIPTIKTHTKLLVLMHCREQKLTTNTARLACLALPHSEIRIRGEREPVNSSPLLAGYTNAILLYPTDDALELNSTLVETLPRPITLVVPDGSWRQARKVATREKELLGIPRIKLPVGAPSSYRLRKAPHFEGLSTFEAIAQAIGILEGKDIQKQLDDLFVKKVERTLWSRGSLKPSECTFPIPETAFEASRIAGRRGSSKTS